VTTVGAAAWAVLRDAAISRRGRMCCATAKPMPRAENATSRQRLARSDRARTPSPPQRLGH
jgi:hypothetical protein